LEINSSVEDFVNSSVKSSSEKEETNQKEVAKVEVILTKIEEEEDEGEVE